jgi:two-component system OmpR family sensor kinase
VLRGEIELALGAIDDRDEMQQSLLAARGQVNRLGRLAGDLLLLARERVGALMVHHEPVDLTDLARIEARRLASVVDLSLDVRGDALIVEADVGRVRQVLTNLAVNSAAAGATAVLVTVTNDQDLASIEWADDGPGFLPGCLTQRSSGLSAVTRRPPAPGSACPLSAPS